MIERVAFEDVAHGNVIMKRMSCMSDEVLGQIARGANAELSALAKQYIVP